MSDSEPKMCSKCGFFPATPAPTNYREKTDPRLLCEICRADPETPAVQKPEKG